VQEAQEIERKEHFDGGKLTNIADPVSTFYFQLIFYLISV